MKRKPFTLRLTGPQIVQLAMASYLLTIAMLLIVKYTNGAWIGHAPVPTHAWTTGLAVPALDLLLGLDILRKTRRLRLARPLLYSALILGAFAGLTLWMWRG